MIKYLTFELNGKFSLRINIVLAIFTLFSCIEKAAQPPNVIIVLTDDQGYGDIGVHGNPTIHTPHLDDLHGQSVRLTDFHVNPTCSPSRAALLTGNNANRVGVWHTIAGRSILYEGVTTMPEIFRDNGYTTGIFGKWHLGDNYPFRPQDRGFDEVLIHKGGGVGQQPDHWDNDYFDDTYFHNGLPEQFTGYCTDVWFENAIKFMDKSKSENRPFFCYIPTNTPHSPFHVDSSFVDRYENNSNVPNPAFYGMIENMDDNLGRLIQYLKDEKLEDNTVLIFMTDNGTSAGVEFKDNGTIGFNAGMRGKKGSEYEGGHRVPFFIRWPQRNLAHGNDIAMLAAHTDVLPTLVDLLNLNVPDKIQFDGISLAAQLKGDAENDTTRVLITDSQRIETPKPWKNSSTMQGKWRLVNGTELYDIKNDPGQQVDLASSNSAKVDELRAHYLKWWEGLRPALDKTVYIPLAAKEEPETILHTHDAHLNDDSEYPAWNQILVRQEVRNTGYYTVFIPEDGLYTFTLCRWPKESGVGLNEGAPEKPAVANTTVPAFPEGVPTNIVQAGISVCGKEWVESVHPGSKQVEFKLELKAGKTQLRVWFQEKSGEKFSANYTYVTRP